VSATPWVRKPERAAGDPPLFLRETVADAPAGARVLDAGCGPGSWPYGQRAELRIASFDVKYPPGPPAAAPHVVVFRADLARLPLSDGLFDLTVCHYVLEHVTALAACCDELARVTKPGGRLYLAVPRSASFDDRLYRFAGWFAKIALLKFRKRIEHQQRFERRIVWLDPSSWIPLRAEHERDGATTLVARTLGIRDIQGVPTPARVVFERPLDHETIDMEFESVDYEAPIPSSFFSTLELIKR